MMSVFKTLLDSATAIRTDTSGVTAIEYGLIMGATAVVIIVGMQAAGAEIGMVFTTLSGTMTQISANG